MIDQATFDLYVREAFARLDDRPFLQTHPLTALLAPVGQTPSPEWLRRALLGAIDQLRPPQGTPPGSAKWRRWRFLALHYIEGTHVGQIARQLRISERQARRDHQSGIDAVADLVWHTYSTQAARGAPPSARETTASGARLDGDSDLESELARLAVGTNEPTSIVEALQGALTTIRSLAEERQAHFDVSFPEELPPVAVNQTVLRQILLCLLTATIQDRPAPRVSLVLASVAGGVEVALTSQGGQRTHPSARAATADLTALVDTARRLAEPHGGTARTIEEADGTRRFELALPALRQTTVLVIDDNPDVVLLFRRFLAGTHFRFVQARTPRTALDLARELHPDAITLDVMMPSLDGWQVLQELRSDPVIAEIPVIVCSILPERTLALSLGVADFLAKPVTPTSLRAALDRLTGDARPAGHRGRSAGSS